MFEVFRRGGENFDFINCHRSERFVLQRSISISFNVFPTQMERANEHKVASQDCTMLEEFT